VETRVPLGDAGKTTSGAAGGGASAPPLASRWAVGRRRARRRAPVRSRQGPVSGRGSALGKTVPARACRASPNQVETTESTVRSRGAAFLSNSNSREEPRRPRAGRRPPFHYRFDEEQDAVRPGEVQAGGVAANSTSSSRSDAYHCRSKGHAASPIRLPRENRGTGSSRSQAGVQSRRHGRGLAGFCETGRKRA